jgi:hypothetical protein
VISRKLASQLWDDCRIPKGVCVESEEQEKTRTREELIRDAAPDLYEAARATVLSMIMGGYATDHPIVKKLESALKKARGEA